MVLPLIIHLEIRKIKNFDIVFFFFFFFLLSKSIGRHSFVPFGHSKILPNKRPVGIVSVLFVATVENRCRASNARGAPT